MKNFKELTEELISLNEYKRGFKSQAAARDVVRSRTPVKAKEDQISVVTTNYHGFPEVAAERPDMPGSGKPDNQLLRYNREVQSSIGKSQSAEARKKAKEEGAVRGAEKAADLKKKTMTIVKNEKAAKSFGIPDIHAIVDGQNGQRDVAGVTVVGHEKNGYIAKHQGTLHFKHPDGKTHANVELRPSPNGIAIWASRSGNKKSVKPIAHIHPQQDAIPVRGVVSKGNINIHSEDELNR